MGIFNIFGKKDVASDLAKPSPYRVSTEWIPYKLYARKKSSAMLVIRLRNMTQEILLTSVVAELPKTLAFDTINVASQRESRIGEMAPGEEKELRFEVFSGLNSDPGEYTLNLTAIAHYRDYGHVINAVKKRVTVEVV